jgi:hypothetical protein
VLVAAKESEPLKAGAKAHSVLSPQSATHVHTTLLNYLQAFQRNEDPGQDLIRDSRPTPPDPPNGDAFTNVHSSEVTSAGDSHSILFEPIDIRYGWPPVNISPFPFNFENINTHFPSSEVLQTDTAAACQVDALLGQEVHLASPGVSHGGVFGASEEGSSVFQQFFADEMAALDSSGPDQGWERFLSS